MAGLVTPWPGADDALDLNGQSEWDRVFIAGVALPGVAQLSGDFGRKIDRKEVPGKNGVTHTDIGYEIAKFQVSLKLWTAVHLVDWQAIAAFVQPRASKTTLVPVQIGHPALQLHGITKAIVLKIGFLKPGSTKGVFETTISFEEWRPGSLADSGSNVDTAVAAKATARGDELPVPSSLKKPSKTVVAP